MERKAIVLVDGVHTQLPDTDNLIGAGDMHTDVYDPELVTGDMYLIDNHRSLLSAEDIEGIGTAAFYSVSFSNVGVAPGDHGHSCGGGDMHTSMYDYGSPTMENQPKDMFLRSSHYGYQALATISDLGEVGALHVGPIETSYDASVVSLLVSPGDHVHTEYLSLLPGITEVDLFDRSNHFGQIELVGLENTGSAIEASVGDGPLDVASGDHDHPDFIGTDGTPTIGFAPTPEQYEHEKVLRGKGDWATLQEVFDASDLEVDVSSLPTYIGATDADGKSGIIPEPSLTDGDAVFVGDGNWTTFSDILASASQDVPESKIEYFRDHLNPAGSEIGKLKAPTPLDHSSILLGRDYEWTSVETAILDSGVLLGVDNVEVYTSSTSGIVPTPEVNGEWKLLSGSGGWKSITSVLNLTGIELDADVIPLVTQGSVGILPDQDASNDVLLTDGSWSSIVDLFMDEGGLSPENVPVMAGASNGGLKGLAPTPTEAGTFLDAEGQWSPAAVPLQWFGDWDPTLSYNELQTVRYPEDGKVYKAVADGAKEMSPKWAEVALPAGPGPAGPLGTQFGIEYVSSYHKDSAFYKLKNAMRNPYVESALVVPGEASSEPEALIPVHDTFGSDVGCVEASSTATSGSNVLEAWRAFDGNMLPYEGGHETHFWESTSTPGWLQYTFNGFAHITSYMVAGTGSNSPKSWTLDASTDGINWTELDKVESFDTGTSSHNGHTFDISSTAYYSIYRLNITANNFGKTNTLMSGFQLFGVLVEDENLLGQAAYPLTGLHTSHTSIEGQANADGWVSTGYPYLAFDSQIDGVAAYQRWDAPNDTSAGHWISYTFTSPKTVTSYAKGGLNFQDSTAYHIRSWTLHGSDDGAIWTLVDTVNESDYDEGIIKGFVVSDPGSYTQYKLTVVQWGGPNGAGRAWNYALPYMQFYGPEKQRVGLIAKHSSDVSVTGESSASATHPSNGTPWKVFDGNIDGIATNDYWATPSDYAMQSVYYRFYGARIATHYRKGGKMFQNNEGFYVHSWKIWGSRSTDVDSAFWTLLDTVTDCDYDDGVMKEFEIANPGPFFLYRFEMVAGVGGNPSSNFVIPTIQYYCAEEETLNPGPYIIEQANGLLGTIYKGGFTANNLDFFNEAERKSNDFFDGMTSSPTGSPVFAGMFSTLEQEAHNAENFSVKWIGYFKASVSGIYEFEFSTDQGGLRYFWLGDANESIHALNVRRTIANVFVTAPSGVNSPLYGFPWTTGTNTVTLVAGEYYPILLYYWDETGWDNWRLAFTPPGGEKTVDGTKHYTRYNPNIPFPSGLFGTMYSGYFNEDFSFFGNDTTAPTATEFAKDFFDNMSVNPTGLTVSNGEFAVFKKTKNNGDAYSIQWRGYFKAQATGVHTFYLYSSDVVWLWLGTAGEHISALQLSRDNTNQLVNKPVGASEVEANISLVAGEYYPILIYYGESTGNDTWEFSFLPPGGTKTNDGYGYYSRYAPQHPDPDPVDPFAQDIVNPYSDTVYSLIPKHTSPSSSEGHADASNSVAGTFAWKAFDGQTDGPGANQHWASPKTSDPLWLRYTFAEPKTVSAYSLGGKLPVAEAGATALTAWELQGSDNGVDWTVLDSVSDVAYDDGVVNEYEIDNPREFLQYRILVVDWGNQTKYAEISFLQLHGTPAPRVGLVPIHTGVTSTAGTAPTVYDAEGTAAQWKAFSAIVDGDSATNSWHPEEGSNPTNIKYITYIFNTSKIVTNYRKGGKSKNDDPTYWVHSWVLEGSNNGTCWVTLDSRSDIPYDGGSIRDFTITTPKSFLQYRLGVLGHGEDTPTTFNIAFLQFYGFETPPGIDIVPPYTAPLPPAEPAGPIQLCLKDVSQIDFVKNPSGLYHTPSVGTYVGVKVAGLTHNQAARVLEGATNSNALGSIDESGLYFIGTQFHGDPSDIEIRFKESSGSTFTAGDQTTIPYGRGHITWATGFINKNGEWDINYPDNVTVFQIIVGTGVEQQCVDRVEGLDDGLKFMSNVLIDSDFPTAREDTLGLNQLWSDSLTDTMKITRPKLGIYCASPNIGGMFADYFSFTTASTTVPDDYLHLINEPGYQDALDWVNAHEATPDMMIKWGGSLFIRNYQRINGTTTDLPNAVLELNWRKPWTYINDTSENGAIGLTKDELWSNGEWLSQGCRGSVDPHGTGIEPSWRPTVSSELSVDELNQLYSLTQVTITDPPSTSKWKAVLSLNNLEFLGIQTDGTLWGWGSAFFGRIGIAAPTTDIFVNHSTITVYKDYLSLHKKLSIPTQFSFGGVVKSDWVDIKGSYRYAIGRDVTGQLYAWGNQGHERKDSDGELGTIGLNSGVAESHIPQKIKWKPSGASEDLICSDYGVGDTFTAVIVDGEIWVTGLSLNDFTKITDIVGLNTANGFVSIEASGAQFVAQHSSGKVIVAGARLINASDAGRPRLVNNDTDWTKMWIVKGIAYLEKTNGAVWALGDTPQGIGIPTYPVSVKRDPILVEGVNTLTTVGEMSNGGKIVMVSLNAL